MAIAKHESAESQPLIFPPKTTIRDVLRMFFRHFNSQIGERMFCVLLSRVIYDDDDDGVEGG
jgi:hypothetical protein